MTECTQIGFDFPPVKRRRIEAKFSGGDITSDGGLLLLRQADRRLGGCSKLSMQGSLIPAMVAMSDTIN